MCVCVSIIELYPRTYRYIFLLQLRMCPSLFFDIYFFRNVTIEPRHLAAKRQKINNSSVHTHTHTDTDQTMVRERRYLMMVDIFSFNITKKKSILSQNDIDGCLHRRATIIISLSQRPEPRRVMIKFFFFEITSISFINEVNFFTILSKNVLNPSRLYEKKSFYFAYSCLVMISIQHIAPAR